MAVKRIKKEVRRSAMLSKLKGILIGSASRKRYITALYVGLRAILTQLGYEIPQIVDNLAVAFGIWAAGDALKKLEK